MTAERQREVAIVTGAGGGIGRATARRLAADGYAVTIAELDEDSGARAAEELTARGHEVRFVATDASDPRAVEQMVAATIEAWGRLDVLVNNVGLGRPGRAHELSLEDWRFVLETSLSSVFYGVKYAVPHMLERGGRIVNVASVQGFRANQRSAAYNAAKGGVINLTRSIALDYARDGIRCNCVCPGHIRTGPREALDERLRARAAQGLLRYPHARNAEEVEEMHALGRSGEPEEVADAVAYLVSPGASFITGEALVVDGGLTIQVNA